MTTPQGALKTAADVRSLLLSWARAGRTTVHEADTKRLLTAAGLPIPRRGSSGPYAVKLAADAFPHKSEHGLVKLGVAPADVGAVTRELRRISDAGEILVEDLVPDGVVELIVGCAHDRTFGPVVMVGLGGIFVELLQEVAFRLVPANPESIGSVLHRGHFAKLLGGLRGRPAADVPGVIDLIVRVSTLFAENADLIAELEINPLIVRPAQSGAVIADALLILKSTERQPD